MDKTDLQIFRLVIRASITTGQQLGRAEMLRGLRHFLNKDRPEHYSIDRLKVREGVEKGSGRHSLQVGEQSMFKQTASSIV